MKNKTNFFQTYLLSALMTISLQLFYTASAKAQFDSLIWMNRYSNHSACSRDNVQKAVFINRNDLYIAASTERDYTNYDVTAFRLNNNLELIWKEDYSSFGNKFSYDIIKDIAVDSSGNIFIIGSSEIDFRTPFLIKRDPSGKLLWVFDFTKSFYAYLELGPCDIETDIYGNCYLIAWNNLYGPDIRSRTLIFKFDKDGNLQWYKGTDLPYPQKIIVDADQNILTINNSDEHFDYKLVLQKYSEDGDLIYDRRHKKMRFEVLDVKKDQDKNLFVFSNCELYNSQGYLSTKAYISKYDSLGNLVDDLLYDDTSDIKKEIKLVQSGKDSTFLIGIDSYSSDNGIDNQLVLINSNLQIIDYFSYDSEFHDNDYLISFDQTNNNDIIVTGISFISTNSSLPYIYKIKNFEEIEWITIPSISDTTEVYPKNVFVDGNGSVILVGDAEMSVKPEFGTTHSNVFITKFSSTGVELETEEYGAEGKSDISASKVKLDSKNNIYVSGAVTNGPGFLYPKTNYDQDVFLCKYSTDGIIQWNNLINLPGGPVDYINHFIKGDSMITVICSFLGKTRIYNIDSNGSVINSVEYDGYAKKVLNDDQGNLFLFLWKSSEFLILKLKSDLSLAKSSVLSNSAITLVYASLKNNAIYFVTGDTGKQTLHKYGTDLDKTWQVNLSAYFENFRTLETDSLGNIFITSVNKGNLVKLASNGTVTWIKQIGYNNQKVKILNSGNLVLTGSECITAGCSPSYLLLLSNTGEVMKDVTVPFYINHLILDNNGFIYLFDSKNRYRKYSPDLNLLADDSFTEKSNGYDYYFNGVVFDSNNELIIAGTLGVSWLYVNGLYSWQTLAVAKVGRVNSSPQFSDKNIEVQTHPGDSLVVEVHAKDYDNDPITFNLLTQLDWVDFDEKTTTLNLKTNPNDTLGYFEVLLIVFDNHAAYDTVKVSITIGNKAPFFTSQPITTVVANNVYSYMSSAEDPDNDVVYYEISTGPVWLNIENTGLLSGTPTSQDVGTYEISIKCYDRYNGYVFQNYNLSVTADNLDVINDYLSYDDDILLYPIPANRNLNILFKKIQPEKPCIRIVDTKGIIIKSYSNLTLIDGSVIQLDINDILPGFYYILIYNDDRLYCRKIAVK